MGIEYSINACREEIQSLRLAIDNFDLYAEQVETLVKAIKEHQENTPQPFKMYISMGWDGERMF